MILGIALGLSIALMVSSGYILMTGIYQGFLGAAFTGAVIGGDGHVDAVLVFFDNNARHDLLPFNTYGVKKNILNKNDALQQVHSALCTRSMWRDRILKQERLRGTKFLVSNIFVTLPQTLHPNCRSG